MRRTTFLLATVLGISLLAPSSAAGGGCHGVGEPTSGRGAKGASVPIEQCMFTPTVLYVEPGTDVTWVNRDPVPHTVSGVALSWGSHDHIDLNGTGTYTFKSEGVFPYYCLLHPSMVGAVVVGDPEPSALAAAPITSDIERTKTDVGLTVGENAAARASALASPSEERRSQVPVLAALLLLVLVAGLVVRTVRRGLSTGGLGPGRHRA